MNRMIPRENEDVRLWVSKNAEGASLREAPSLALAHPTIFVLYWGVYERR